MNRWLNPKTWRIAIFLVIAALYALVFPSKLFNDPTSTLILANDESLLSAQIAEDGQWRFPPIDSIPKNLETAILHFEDEYFHMHPGVNPVSTLRALWQNITSGKVQSGGSTITMQVIRLSRKGQSRTVFEKIIEMYLAVRMEFTYSKDEILRLYVTYAPYGGNVVGVETASWRYYNRPPDLLSWAEVSTLAVLPNSPALIHPGRNRSALEAKRNRLLSKLLRSDIIDSTEFSLAIMEPLPDNPKPLPGYAMHLLNFANQSGHKGSRTRTNIDPYLQKGLSDRVDRYVSRLSENQIHNACAMIVSLETGDVVAYVGNARVPETRSPFVDIIHSARSSGSILKPFLYAKSIEMGLIHPTTLLRDVPVTIGKYAPLNFDRSYEGAVRAEVALAKSLNIPATLLLKNYGLIPFYENLQDLGFSTINRPVGNYGLTLILGGAEVKLWDLAVTYTTQAMNLKRSNESLNDSIGLRIWKGGAVHRSKEIIDPAAWWQTSEALTNVQRPGLNKDWRKFSSSRKIAWKTGTSHGFRDAWAVGFDGKHLIAVWVGNSDGEGRPGLTGTSVASPLMFEAFQMLPKGNWFNKPEGYMKQMKLCATSGCAPTQYCPTVDADFPENANAEKTCDVHKKVVLNTAGHRVYMDCAQTDTRDTIWFSLDPVAAYFYKQRNSNYRPLPALSKSCSSEDEYSGLAIIYPISGSELVVPKNFDNEFEDVVLHATHADPKAQLFWHLDEDFIQLTTYPHKFTWPLEQGSHVLLVQDEAGQKAKSNIKVYR